MKSIVSLLSILAFGFGLFSCAAKEEVPIANTAAAAPYGVAGNAYSETLAATCSTVPLPWTLSNGALPSGLSFTGATGDVTGTPTAAGNSTVVFAGTDSTGKTVTCAVSFVVRPRTDRVSVDTFGNSVTGATNREPSISSADGRFIAFTSIPSFTGATLIAGVTGQQILLHDRQTGQLSLISKDNFGSAGTGVASSAASVSADGRYIAFVSTATNLVPGVTGQQIYLHDRQTSPAFPNGKTTLVSKDGAGNPANAGGSILSNASPTISADGRYVAFVSNATNLDPLVPVGSGLQIYLHDTQPTPNGQTTLVSKDRFGVPVSPGSLILSSSPPRISADGRFVVFVSTSTDIVSGVIGQQIYLYNRLTGQASLVSKNNFGSAGIGGVSSAPSVSKDGRFVAFVSTAPNLVDPPVSGQQIYLHDTQTSPTLPNGQTRLVSKDDLGNPASAASLTPLSNTSPTISDDGLFVAFVSNATNLIANVNGQQIYLHNTETSPTFPNGQTTLVSRDEVGTPAIAGAPLPSPVITANGAFVAFVSSATNLVTAPPAAASFDVYVRAARALP
jgi:Tol biopolymer transport system component